jgi:hypothetical protein
VSDSSKDDKDGSREAADAFKALLSRIGDIFGVFDLSFFVAGAVCFAALIFGAYVFGATWVTRIDLTEWKAVHVIAAILGCYVLGLVCFAAGRKLRRDQHFYLALPGHLVHFGLEGHYGALLPGPREGPHASARKCALLYTRLWAEVRQSKTLAPSFNLLTRYWILAAMCDGLAAAFAVWTALWVFWAAQGAPGHPSTQVLLLGGLGLVLAVALCISEARRYGEYQMYELVATLAHQHRPIEAPPAGTGREQAERKPGEGEEGAGTGEAGAIRSSSAPASE